MKTLLDILLLIVGFFLLIKGADVFVDGASGIAKKLKIPSIVIGLTVVAFGTSLPEAAVSIAAALAGSNEIAVSNVIGSNIFNLLMVTGISALVGSIAVDKSVLKRDFPLAILSAALMFMLAFDRIYKRNSTLTLSHIDGIIFLAFFVLFIIFNVRSALKYKASLADEEPDEKLKSVPMYILLSLLGIAGISIGGKLTVMSAQSIALTLHVSETLIGLTIIAIGTSLPELVTSVVALKKNESDIALGNVLGSNIFNVFFVLGVSAAIHPINVDMLAIYDTIILTVISIAMYLVFIKTKKTTKPFAISMLITYIAYSAYIILR